MNSRPEVLDRIDVGGDPVNFVDPAGLYCGSGWNEYFVSDTPCGYDFGMCCKAHDECYGCKGAATGKTKRQCESEFRACLMNVCNSRRYPPPGPDITDIPKDERKYPIFTTPSLKECTRVENDNYKAVDKWGDKPFKMPESAVIHDAMLYLLHLLKRGKMKLLVFIPFLLASCINIRTALTQNSARWEPFDKDTAYYLKRDVFLIRVNSRKEPTRLALVPASTKDRGAVFKPAARQ